jgi:hypothetical protein
MSVVPGIVQRALRKGDDKVPLPEGEKASLRSLLGDAGFKTLVDPNTSSLNAKEALVKNKVLSGVSDAEAKLLLKYVIDGVRTRVLADVRKGSHAHKEVAIEQLSKARSRSRSRNANANAGPGAGRHESRSKGPSASARKGRSGRHDGGGRRTRRRGRKGSRRS